MCCDCLLLKEREIRKIGYIQIKMICQERRLLFFPCVAERSTEKVPVLSSCVLSDDEPFSPGAYDRERAYLEDYAAAHESLCAYIQSKESPV